MEESVYICRIGCKKQASYAGWAHVRSSGFERRTSCVRLDQRQPLRLNVQDGPNRKPSFICRMN